MSIKFNVCLNNGNEVFGTGKSITANEVCDTAADLAARVGVTVRPRAQVTQKFADLLDQKKGSVERNAVIEKPYVTRTGTTPTDPTNPDNPDTTPTNPDDPNAGND